MKFDEHGILLIYDMLNEGDVLKMGDEANYNGNNQEDGWIPISKMNINKKITKNKIEVLNYRRKIDHENKI